MQSFENQGMSNVVGLATESAEILRFFSVISVSSVAEKSLAHFRHSRKSLGAQDTFSNVSVGVSLP